MECSKTEIVTLPTDKDLKGRLHPLLSHKKVLLLQLIAVSDKEIIFFFSFLMTLTFGRNLYPTSFAFLLYLVEGKSYKKFEIKSSKLFR